MITRHPTIIATLAFGMLVATTGPAAALTYTCATVDRQDLFDPDMVRFSSKFESPDVNSSGDTVFIGRTKSPRLRKLYLYPGAGGEQTIAAQGGAAPGGSTFEQFESASINDAGDIGFAANLDVGHGVFVRPAGGPILAAALGGQAAPGGGTFETFPDVSDVNDDGDIAFIAKLTGGATGVYFYDRSLATVSAVALTGGSTGGGRSFCSFINVTTGSTRPAFQAVTETTCGVSNDPETTIFQYSGVYTEVATVGDPAVLPGTTIAKLFDIHSNMANDVGYRAKINGTVAGNAVFLFTPSVATTVLVVQGDTAPRSGGSIRTIPQLGGITDTDQVAFRGKIVKGGAKHGVFLFDTTDDAAVLTFDPVPDDQWGTTASYRNIDEDTGVSASGTWVTFIAKVRDSQTPSGTGVFRCQGS